MRGGGVLLTAGAIGGGGLGGQLATHLSSLLPPGARYCAGLRTVVGNYGSLDILLCVLEGETREDMDAAKPLLEGLSVDYACSPLGDRKKCYAVSNASPRPPATKSQL